jgi:hypothetical protein
MKKKLIKMKKGYIIIKLDFKIKIKERSKVKINPILIMYLRLEKIIMSKDQTRLTWIEK